MPEGRLHLDGALPAAEALARGQALLDSVVPDRPVMLYAAPLDAAAVVIGAYQHAPQALRAQAFEALALPILRRRTGGAAAWGGAGVSYVALGLLNASALMPCPYGRILNRNVRGLLAGIRGLGVPTHYFGRDFISFGTDPGAYVAWDESADGRVLLEFFVGVETVFTPAPELDGYPPRVEPALRGKQPTTLHAAKPSISAAELSSAIAEGYAKGFAVEFTAEALSPAELALTATLRKQSGVDLGDTCGLCWSSPHEEAIGFVTAGVRLDARGHLSALKLAGDFFQQRECPAELATRLIGQEPTADTVGAALDAVYTARPGLIEGVRSLNMLREVILNASERASAG